MQFGNEKNTINSITVNDMKKKEKQLIVDLKQTSKKKILFKIVLFTIILIIIPIYILLNLFNKEEKLKIYPNGEDKPSNPESINFSGFQIITAEEKYNSIKAIYSLHKKEELVLFNPEKSTSPKTSMI